MPQGLPEPGIGRSTREANARGDYGTAEPSRLKQGGTWKDDRSFTRPHLINARHPIGQITRASAAFSRGIVPEALELARPLRQQVDLDSMDWLNFLVSLHERFGVEIAESDYARLISLNDVVDYLQARLV